MEKVSLVAIGVCATCFGVVALYLGYDSVVISSLFGLLGGLAGYIFGKKSD